MPTRSKAHKPQFEEHVTQGDVFRNVRYNYIDSEDGGGVNVVEFEFPFAVVISQACDAIAMDNIIANKKGKPAKFMPSILLCPIYDKIIAKSGTHLSNAFSELGLVLESENIYHGDDYNVAQRDWHYRFHSLEVVINEKSVIKDAIIDFKHYFTVPMSYLVKNKENRFFHLDDLFAEQISLKFATFLSRVAIPD